MAINESCLSKQTFCALGHQTAASLLGDFNYSSCVEKGQIIDKTTWNEIVDQVVNIFNYGEKGTRNPTSVFSYSMPAAGGTTGAYETANSATLSASAITNKHNAGETITLSDYNSLVNTLKSASLSTSSSQFLLSIDDMNKIKNSLNNYTINDTRCNDCNVSCNSTCQTSNQCHCNCDCFCDCDCYSWCYSCGHICGYFEH